MLLFMQYIVKYNISGDQLEHLCKLFEIHLPNIIPKSKYLFKQKFLMHFLYDVYMYCHWCKYCLGKTENEGQCPLCRTPVVRKIPFGETNSLLYLQ